MFLNIVFLRGKPYDIHGQGLNGTFLQGEQCDICGEELNGTFLRGELFDICGEGWAGIPMKELLSVYLLDVHVHILLSNP